MLLPELINLEKISDGQMLCIEELAKLQKVDTKIYQTIMESDSVNIDQFYQIIFAVLDYGYFNLFTELAIQNQQLLCSEMDKRRRAGHRTSGLQEEREKCIREVFEKIKKRD